MHESGVGVQRFSVSFPSNLKRVVDELARERGTTRSGLLAGLVSDAERRRVAELMAEGYQVMAEENRRLANEALPSAADVMLRDVDEALHWSLGMA